jgi:membrane protease YdiL (CAAX protease family)
MTAVPAPPAAVPAPRAAVPPARAAGPAPQATLLAPRAALLTGAAGCLLLVARPSLLQVTGHRTVTLVVLFVALLAVGGLWPVSRPAVGTRAGGTPPVSATAVLAAGVAAFALGRLLAGGQAPLPFTASVVALNSLAAVSEEAFFRRLVYDALAPRGAAAAVAGSAVLFAVVHVGVYGAWVLPLDVAAGLVLGWQRWATGSWAVPGATHLVANLVMVI